MRLWNLLKYYLFAPPRWDRCKRASCWDGANAERRMMNIVSPAFGDGEFKSRVNWMVDRGCDTAHVILINQRDGEGAGYNCATDTSAAKVAKKRIAYLRKRGFAVVPWVITDDSSAWARDLFANADARVKALAKAGLFRDASYVVLGLEMDEYGSANDWQKVKDALCKAGWRGKIGVHQRSERYELAGLGDIFLGQIEPSKATPQKVAAQIDLIRNHLSKAAVGFEYWRSPNRELAEAALKAGAIGVGNW